MIRYGQEHRRIPHEVPGVDSHDALAGQDVVERDRRRTGIDVFAVAVVLVRDVPPPSPTARFAVAVVLVRDVPPPWPTARRRLATALARKGGADGDRAGPHVADDARADPVVGAEGGRIEIDL